MDGWVFFLSLSPRDLWSVHACPMQVHVHAVPVSIPPVTRHPVSAHYFFTLIISVLSQLIFRPAYSFSASPPPPPCPHYSLLVICSFNFSTHSLHSSFSLPFLLLLQSNLSDLSLFPPSLSLSCWRSGFLSQFTFLPLHCQICFLAFLDLRWVTATLRYLIPTMGMVQSTGDGSSPCCH